MLRPPPLIFADGASLDWMQEHFDDSAIAGFTTNPTLLKKLGVNDYAGWARKALDAAACKPVSLEVISDTQPEMIRQGQTIQLWGDNAVVKLPVLHGNGCPTVGALSALVAAGVRVNLTGVMCAQQLTPFGDWLTHGNLVFVSVFAGRIADRGFDPVETVRGCAKYLHGRGSRAMVIWASPREVCNVWQAAEAGAWVITLPPALIGKLKLTGEGLLKCSIETCREFLRDAQEAGLTV